MEDTLDECINDSMRSLDQMCFSSQYYFMLALYLNGLMLMVLGMEMMIRHDYNMWSDPVMLILLVFTCCMSYLAENILKCLASWVSILIVTIFERALLELITDIDPLMTFVVCDASCDCGRSSMRIQHGYYRSRMRTSSSCLTWTISRGPVMRPLA